MEVDCGGVISEVKRILTKIGNKPMAILTVEDMYGEFDCMMFPKTYEKFADSLSSDRIVHIFGKLSVRVGEKPIILIEKIEYMDEKDKTNNSATQTNIQYKENLTEQQIKKVYLKFDLTNKKLVSEIGEIMACYPGESPAFVQFNNKLYSLNVCVEPSNALVAELSGIIGIENIKVI